LENKQASVSGGLKCWLGYCLRTEQRNEPE
jgi:hypothetical protein